MPGGWIEPVVVLLLLEILPVGGRATLLSLSRAARGARGEPAARRGAGGSTARTTGPRPAGCRGVGVGGYRGGRVWRHFPLLNVANQISLPVGMAPCALL